MPTDQTAEFQRLANSSDIEANHEVQFQLMCVLQLMWPTLNPQQQGQYRDLVTRLVRRIRDSPDPATVFELILGLPQQELIYDAIRFDSEVCWQYELEPGEDIYRTADPTSAEFMGRYLWWARMGNCPLGFHAWAGMAVLSTVAQRRILFPGGNHIWMNMYIMLGGNRSTGKGQAFSAAMDLLHEVNRQIDLRPWPEPLKAERRVNLLAGDSTMESIVNELDDLVHNRTDDEVNEDEEGLTEITIGHRAQTIDATGLISLDEAATFFGKDAFGAARKGVFLTEAKEAGRYIKRTKGGGLEALERLALGMLACCAPSWMQGVIDRSLLGSGLMDRIQWVYREPAWARRRQTNIRNSPPRDPLIMQGLACWLIDNVLCQETKVISHLSDEAAAAADEFYLELLDKEQLAYEKFGAAAEETTANRAYWIMLQVSTLLAVCDGNFPPLRVELHHVEEALVWIRAEFESMRQFLGEASKTADLLWDKKIVDYIAERCGGCVKRSLLMQAFRGQGLGKAHEIDVYLHNLEESGQIEKIEIRSPHKTVVYRIPGHCCEKCKLKE